MVGVLSYLTSKASESTMTAATAILETTSDRKLFLDNTMGAAFIGTCVAAGLHGVSCVQAWYYFTHQTDKWGTRALVAVTIIFDTVHQALISHTVYTYVITGFDQPEGLARLVWSLLVEVIFNGLTALLVQCFLTARIWKLSQNMYLAGTVLVLVGAEFACVIAYVSKALSFSTFVELSHLKALSITVNALGAAGDVLIAGTLCSILHMSRTGFQKSDTMINKLIMFAVNTGLLTSICAVASLISIVVAPDTFLYIAFFFCLGRLYTNSLLATLNARKSIRNAAEGVTSICGESDGPRLNTIGKWQSMNRASRSTNVHPNPKTNISIKIDTTKECDRESESDNNSPGQSDIALGNIVHSQSDKNPNLFNEQV